MMGIPMEVLFGNPLTFPRCGFSPDEWVAAFRHNNSYIPLTELGPDHEQWGMATRGGVPVVTNKARQHIMYAESGSFGAFLIDTFGKARVLKFYRFSAGTKRPWEEVFGKSLKDLEAQWLRDLETTRKPDGKNVRHLLNLIKKDPEKACSEAQELANADSPKK
jgi:hypothetical protein